MTTISPNVEPTFQMYSASKSGLIRPILPKQGRDNRAPDQDYDQVDHLSPSLGQRKHTTTPKARSQSTAQMESIICPPYLACKESATARIPKRRTR
jgi:hypothetical protein